MEFELQSPELEINTSNKDFDITETQEDITLEIDNSEMSFQSEHNELSFETPQIGFDYNISSNKPSINGVELVGNKTTKDLGIETQDLRDYAKKTDIPTKTSELENDSGFLTEEDIPATQTIPTIVFKDISQLSKEPAKEGSSTYLTLTPTAEQQAILEDDNNTIIKVDLSAFTSTYSDIVPYIWLKKNIQHIISPITGINLKINLYEFGVPDFNYDNVTSGYISMSRIGNGSAIYNVTAIPSILSRTPHFLFVSFANFNIDKTLDRITALENVETVEINIENGPASGSIMQKKSENNFTFTNPYETRSEAQPVGAHGNYSSVLNGYSRAENSYASVEGVNNIASGYGSHAEGNRTISKGTYTHSEGQGTCAEGTLAHAEGQDTHAKGDISHAEGQTTVAQGYISHAEGLGSKAIGDASHAEGRKTEAGGMYSHAEGEHAHADHKHSHASGYYTRTGMEQQTVIGKFNLVKDDCYFVVGNGGGESTRSNAFEITKKGYITLPNYDSKDSATPNGYKTFKNVNGMLVSDGISPDYALKNSKFIIKEYATYNDLPKPIISYSYSTSFDYQWGPPSDYYTYVDGKWVTDVEGVNLSIGNPQYLYTQEELANATCKITSELPTDLYPDITEDSFSLDMAYSEITSSYISANYYPVLTTSYGDDEHNPYTLGLTLSLDITLPSKPNNEVVEDVIYKVLDTNKCYILNTETREWIEFDGSTLDFIPAMNFIDNIKQDKLTSGQNIVTINGQSLLGSGDLSLATSSDLNSYLLKTYVRNSRSTSSSGYTYDVRYINNMVKTSRTTSSYNTYDCTYINGLVKTSKTSSSYSTYSCNYIDSNFLTLDTLPRWDGGNE